MKADDLQETYADIALARRELGFEPRDIPVRRRFALRRLVANGFTGLDAIQRIIWGVGSTNLNAELLAIGS